MSTEPHGVARDQLRAFIERIERLEEEKKSIADDIKDVYGEAKGTGFDTKILRKVIQIRKQDRDERAEQEAILDSYLAALGMIDQPGFFDDEPSQPRTADHKARAALRTSEAMDDNKAFSAELVAAGLISEEAHAETVALSDAVARKYGAGVIDPTTGEILEASDGSPSVSSSLTTREAEESVVPYSPETATQSLANGPCEAVSERTATQVDASASAEAGVSGQPEMIPATSAESAGEAVSADLPTNSPETATECAAPEKDAAADERSVEADGGAALVRTSNTGEGAASALPAKPKISYRPNCQHPENCASGTRDHCWSCRRAMQKSEEAA